LIACSFLCCFFFSSRRRHTRSKRDWSSDVCSSDLVWTHGVAEPGPHFIKSANFCNTDYRYDNKRRRHQNALDEDCYCTGKKSTHYRVDDGNDTANDHPDSKVQI